MRVYRTEWEELNTLIESFGETEERLKDWTPLTSAISFKKKLMLESFDKFIKDLEELELSMEYGYD